MENRDKISLQKESVHKVLAYSYAVYFALFLIGLFFDLVFDIKIYSSSSMMPVGVFFLISGTFLILWAQKTSRNLKKENISKEAFYRGPYCYTRSPTHWGILFLVIGFGMFTNTFFVILSAFISFIISKFTFLNKEEKILEEKYGVSYREYKKAVKF